MAQLTVPPLTQCEKALDAAMAPLMKMLMWARTGTFKEAPQQTHGWNNLKLPPERLASFDPELFVSHAGDPDAPPVGLGGMAYIHALTKWRGYIVITPEDPEGGWHIGWTCPYVTGISRIRLTTPARVTLSPGPAAFFGVSAQQGTQVGVREIGRGVLGRIGEFSRLPLL